MHAKRLLLPFLILISYCSFSQGVGIGIPAPDASAVLDITHTAKGLLIPRMNTAAMHSITAPARGLLVYDSTVNQLMLNTGTPVLPNWKPVAESGTGNGWNITGNSGTNSTHFIGTTDNQPVRFRVNDVKAGELHPVTGNVFWGLRAGQENTTGYSNIAMGTDALKLNTEGVNLVAIGDSALFNNGRGSFIPLDAAGNTAIGSKSLFTNTTGSFNTATGIKSLFSNTDGRFNVASGALALLFNTTGSFNTAIGHQSLNHNTTANINTAIGYQSLFSNTTGFGNTAGGASSLFSNTTGIDNTAFGYAALNFNVTGENNTGVGRSALIFNTTGNNNTAVGNTSLFNNSTGNANTGIGVNTLVLTTTSSNNTVIGANAGIQFNLGSGNTLIGAGADAGAEGATNCVAIGAGATCNASNQVRLGNFATTSIVGQVGFSSLSDGRYKINIQETVKGLDFIMKLRPVTYQLDMTSLNRKLDPAGKLNDLSKDVAEQEQTILTGFVAQEVEQAAKELGYDFSGVDKPKNGNELYGLRYAEFVVPLVKAVQEQQQLINELKKQNERLLNRVEKLESGISVKNKQL